MLLTSRKSIDNLGVRFRDRTEQIGDRELIQDYRLFRSDDFIENFFSIREVLEGHHAVLGGRMKRTDTIIRKLRREHNMKLTFMDDICGYRIIVPSLKTQSIFLETIEKNFDVKNIRNYVENPKESGYQGIHIICKVPKIMNNNDTPSILTMEIQLRTHFQHIWSTLSESMGEQIKIGEGSSEERIKLNLLSEEINKYEKNNPGFAQIDLPKSVSSMSLDVIHYDKSRGKRIISESFNEDLQEALAYYKWLENEMSSNLNSEVVLLASTENLNLDKSHTRYFRKGGKPAIPSIFKNRI